MRKSVNRSIFSFDGTRKTVGAPFRPICFVLCATALMVVTPLDQAFATGLTELTVPGQSSRRVQTPREQTDKLHTSTLTRSKRRSARPDYSSAPPLITVSLSQQQLKIYNGLDIAFRTQVSSGKKGHATPTGIFSILEKKKYHESNLYSNAPMPYMQRLTWSGIALHEGRVPPYPASHGCVRLPKGAAKRVFGKTRYGNHVIVSHGTVRPRAISHWQLFQPNRSDRVLASLRPAIDSVRVSTRTKGGKKRPALRIYATRTTRRDRNLVFQKMLNAAGYWVGEPDGLYGRETVRMVKKFQEHMGLKITGTMTDETRVKLEQRTSIPPVSDGKIYVRQNQKPVFEADISIKDKKKPLGTHLAYVAELRDDRANWIGVTVPTRIRSSVVADNSIDKSFVKQRVSTSLRSALNRITLPEEARKFIEKNLSMATSFAISDNGFGTETGKGTDFIVQTY